MAIPQAILDQLGAPREAGQVAKVVVVLNPPEELTSEGLKLVRTEESFYVACYFVEEDGRVVLRWEKR